MICRGSEVNATRAIGDQSDQTTEHERTEVETRGEADAKRRCDARRRDIDRDAKPPQSPERRQKHPTTPRDLARCERSHSPFSAPASPDTRQRTISLLYNSSIQQIHISGHALSRVALIACSPDGRPTLTPRHSPHATIDTAETIHLGHVGMQPTSAPSRRG
jgi:hypothetical protein